MGASKRTFAPIPIAAVKEGTLSMYVIRRVLYGIFVVWAAYTVTWVLLYLLPGDPVSIMLRGAGTSDEATRAALSAEYGLDRPLYVQYFTLLFKILTGNIGNSIQYGTPIPQLILDALPQTIALGLAAVVVSAVVGIGIGIWANVIKRDWLRNFFFSLPSFFLSVPTFLVGLLLIQIFAFRLHLVPAVGNQGFASLILPAIALGLPASASVAQVATKSLYQYLQSSQATYLRARGVPAARLLLRHGLRNAIIPSVTILGIQVGGILAGAVITETVFSRQGLGRVLQNGVLNQDIPVVQAVVLLSAVLYVLSNLVIDILYPWLDPRIRKA